MAINVKIKCSDCGTVAERSLRAEDKEIICPGCQRNMPNLAKDDFKDASKTLGSQRILGVVSLLFLAGAIALLVMYVGPTEAWVSTDNPEVVKRMEKAGVSRNADTTMFMYGAAGCALLCGVFGALSARKRYVVEF